MEKILPNVSSSTIIWSSDSDIDINTFYDQNKNCEGNLTNLPLIIAAVIADSNVSLNSIIISNGYLGIVCKEYGLNILFWIDSDGNFFISSEDSEKYSIDSNGDLIYTIC